MASDIPGPKMILPTEGKKGTLSLKRFGEYKPVALADIREFDHLKIISGFSVEILAFVLGTTARTIQYKRSAKTPFDLPLTDRLRRLTQLFLAGTELFGTTLEFISWLNNPAYGLDNAVPFDLLQEPGGLDILMEEIIAIKYGDTL